jgi:hypothetical protein
VPAFFLNTDHLTRKNSTWLAGTTDRFSDTSTGGIDLLLALNKCPKKPTFHYLTQKAKHKENRSIRFR